MCVYRKMVISLFCVKISEHYFSDITSCMSLQSCLTLCDPMDYSPQGSSVHAIFQARIFGVGCHFFLQETFLTRGLNPHLLYLLHEQADILPFHCWLSLNNSYLQRSLYSSVKRSICSLHWIDMSQAFFLWVFMPLLIHSLYYTNFSIFIHLLV